MDAGRSAERAGQMRQGSLPSQYPQHTRHRLGEWTGTRKPGPKSTHPSRSSEERRARTTMLRGRVPAPDIFSGRERVSRQPENAEPRHPMEVFSQLAPKTACSLVQWPAQHAQLEQRASHAAVR